MKTLLNATNSSFREKGSKFIGHLFPAESREAFEEQLEQIRSETPDATHHCYAWRIDPADLQEFAQDDGEPGGTAGLPILNRLKSAEAVNCGLVVVRYYGGTNLGKGGLIEAYGRAAGLCLDQARLKSVRPVRRIALSYPYPEQNTVDRLIHTYDLRVVESSYLETVSLTLACPPKQVEALCGRLEQLLHKGLEYEVLGKSYL